MKKQQTSPAGPSVVWEKLGEVIALHPGKVKDLLRKHRIAVAPTKDMRVLVDGVIAGLTEGRASFQEDLSALLAQYDNFLGEIAGAISSVVDVIGGSQNSKAAQVQARSETLSAILAYKAQQQRNQWERERLKNQKPGPRTTLFSKKAVLVIGGVLAILLVVGLIWHRNTTPRHPIQHLTPHTK